jgi:hypothetical protein
VTRDRHDRDEDAGSVHAGSIQMNEGGRHALVRDLAAALADAAPGPTAEELEERAQVLASRFR